MVEMWRGLDLPAWEAPYILRDTRLGYLNGYERALISGEMSEEQISNAAESRQTGPTPLIAVPDTLLHLLARLPLEAAHQAPLTGRAL
jgi:hypothetical protein